MQESPLKPRPHLDPLLTRFVELGGSDMYLTMGVPPSVRVVDRIVALTDLPLLGSDVDTIVAELLDDDQWQEFSATMEYNLPLSWTKTLRFRINVFRQQQHSGLVIRRIQATIPTIEQLKLPAVYKELIMESRGLVLVVGATGAGKSSSLAAMIGHRNQHGFGHIITIEDPIEFVHSHKGCIITQRDVGVDTFSFSMALKNTLRQRPDVVLIGEIRDRETLEHALHFSETGHLCVSTLHAGSVPQAIERILNFFPAEKHHQLLYNLSQNIKGILCQRLVLTEAGTRIAAVEVMLNRGLIRNLIQEGKIKDIHEVMSKNRNEGMQTMDQALYQLHLNKVISEDVAIAESENAANLRLQIRQAQPASTKGPSFALHNTNTTF
jgi:twitching motility protein PilU